MEVLNEMGEIISNPNKNTYIVKMNSSSNCEECSAKIICKNTNEEIRTIEVESDSKFSIGEKVVLEIEGKSLVKTATVLYLIPLLIVLTVIGFSLEFLNNIRSKELISTLFSVVFLAAYYKFFPLIFSSSNHVLSLHKSK